MTTVAKNELNKASQWLCDEYAHISKDGVPTNLAHYVDTHNDGNKTVHGFTMAFDNISSPVHLGHATITTTVVDFPGNIEVLTYLVTWTNSLTGKVSRQVTSEGYLVYRFVNWNLKASFSDYRDALPAGYSRTQLVKTGFISLANNFADEGEQ